jgi:F420-dependent oxidoreductase-like protein
MQFDWMVQCYPGAGEHRDAPLLDSLELETVMNGVDAAVDAGIEGLWAPDHFMLGPEAEEYEVWTLLSALAERTDDVDLGPLVGSITYRNPALLAKMATTVDILSEGRVQLGLGTGWYEEEHHAYGYDFPDVETRLEMLEEGIDVVRAMFTESEPSYDGDHYRIENAPNNPKPVQDPHPPIVIGGIGPKMLRLTAKHADEWNAYVEVGGDKSLEFKVRKFEEYLAEEGRSPDDVRKSWLGHVLVREDESELQEYYDEIFPMLWGESAEMEDIYLDDPADARETAKFLIGTPEEVIEGIEELGALGFDRFQLFFLDFPETKGMEVFGDEVAPAFE